MVLQKVILSLCALLLQAWTETGVQKCLCTDIFETKISKLFSEEF